MARLLRVQFTGAIYHAMVRGNEGRSICRDERDYRRLLEKLAEAREVDAVRVYLVCLMPNHVHLLVETPRGNLSAFMGRWLTGYTVYFNRRHQRVGHLTQGRYKAQVVEGDQYLLKLSRYIHLNPVCGKRWEGVEWRERREQLRAYRWSTYRGYAGLEAHWPWIEYAPLRARVGGRGEAAAAYGAYVEGGLARTDKEFSTLYREARLSVGSGEFAERVRQVYAQDAKQAAHPEDVALRRMATARLSAEEVLSRVAAVLGVREEAFRQRSRDSLPRALAAWALVRYAGLNQREAAGVLGLGTGAAVSQLVARWRQATAAAGRWHAVGDEVERKLGVAKL
jgi:REP element-mobilizing transposase RayT